jgi:HipA-like protein
MKKIKKVFSWLFNSEEQEELITPTDAKEEFILKYKDVIIGYLRVKEGSWTFQYSDEFKTQENLNVLVDFPDTGRVYEALHLWPFFAHRIPGLGQPQVQEIIEKEKLNKKSEVDLLKRFGQHTITNPFELVAH